MAKLTPMMEQYLDIKNEYKDCLVFFRLGDFYEMFYEDATIASKELEITLTGKDCGQTERAPMCGVPFHSADSYIARLVEKGYKVAICEQLENPKDAKGIVKRDVIRVVTPGTVLDNSMLDETKNNYIMCILSEKSGYGIAVCDVTTGEFQTTEFSCINAVTKIMDETARIKPAEVICNEWFACGVAAEQFKTRFQLKLNTCENWMFDLTTAYKKLCRHFKVQTLDGFGLKKKLFSVCASGCLLEYLYQTQKNNLDHITTIKNYTTNDFMLLDISSRRNLELTETLREKSRKGSLLWVLDQTKTAMGARLLRKWIEQPLLQAETIQQRLEAVAQLKSELFIREEIKEVLKSMYDFERIMGKVIYQTANGKDLIALKCSLTNLPLLKDILKRCHSPYLDKLHDNLDVLEDIHILIETAIVDSPPFSVREGGMIKKGYNKELDMYAQAKEQGSDWIAEYEASERKKTGIKNLKISYNKIFGYYIEITKSNLDIAPDYYTRRQTLANCERFTTPELNKFAEVILGSEEKIVDLEYKLFSEVRNKVAQAVERIQNSAHIVSTIDVLQSMSEVADRQGYVMPAVTTDGTIDIKEGRHPVVEKMISEQFISNDTYLDADENRLLIITGPNMAGKSTYMRQTALIVLMAQIGSFVPAQSAVIGIVDRIFTRVGASDDLASGQSTFMVEMTELANILNNATKNSLLILDEIGRGTSTFDGLSIAWAVLEYITDLKQIGAKTLFATHYHELTELEGKLNGVKNYSISVKEQGEDIIFLRKIIRGGTDNSYGIQVARLAGLPNKVVKRSYEILKKLNAADITKKAKNIAKDSKEQSETTATQVDMFTIKETQIIDEINQLDVMSMTPIQALQALFDLQSKAKGQ